MGEDISNRQMREWIEKDLEVICVQMAHTFNGRLHPEFEDCDREAQTVTLRFPLHDWEVNGIGTLHGGIMSCAADLTISLLLHYFADSEIPPTVSMTTNYIRPVPMKGCMLVKARMTSLGRTMGTGYCEIIIPESGKVAATVVATFAIPRKKTE